MDLALNGPLADPRLGSYIAGGTVSGIFFDSRTEGFRDTEYLSPDIRNLYGQLTLFPVKTYRLRFYGNRSDDNSLRLELNNRSNTEVWRRAS